MQTSKLANSAVNNNIYISCCYEVQKYQSNLEIHGKFNVALFDAGAPGAE